MRGSLRASPSSAGTRDLFGTPISDEMAVLIATDTLDSPTWRAKSYGGVEGKNSELLKASTRTGLDQQGHLARASPSRARVDDVVTFARALWSASRPDGCGNRWPHPNMRTRPRDGGLTT